MSAAPVVLIVDDEPDLIELVSLTLGRMSLGTSAAGDLAGARALLSAQRFALCLTDMRLPDGDGLELVAHIQEHSPDTPVAVITAHGNVESAVRALKLGAFDFVSKPLDLGVLRKLVATAIKLGSRDASRPAGSAADAGMAVAPLQRLMGNSTVILKLRELIARVARSQAPVHITGESGTGKELVARLIHETGARADGPFIPVNCGAIPSELMESELFGHKRGSFTGAVADKKGLVQSAEGGTLFLDEVADLPLHMQVKLLRIIQEKTVRPVGEQREFPIDVRVLSATHKSLANWWRRVDFAKISTTESTSSKFACPRCASTPTTSRSSPPRCCGGWRLAVALRCAAASARRLRPRCSTTVSPATSANSKTSSNARLHCRHPASSA